MTEYRVIDPAQADRSEGTYAQNMEHVCFCAFPFLYVYPHIKEKYILTGWAADGYYGVSKRANIHYKHTKELLDVFRNGYFGKLDKESQKFTPGNPVGVKQQMLLAETIDSTLVAPYIDK